MNDDPLSGDTLVANSVKYGLVIYAIGQKEFCPITKEEYGALESAKLGLVALLHIEEKFDMLIENYLELEHDLLSIALRDMATFDHSSHASQDNRGLINRRLLNFLSAGRLYLDQIKQHLSEIDTHILTEITALISATYDAQPDFRIMEALRNYVQHCGFPSHSITHSAKWLPPSQSARLQIAVHPSVILEELGKDKKFKKKALEDLEAIAVNGKVYLMPCVRQYVELLGGIHVQLRKALEHCRELWDAAFLNAQSKFASTYPNTKTLGLAAVIQTGTGGWSGKIEVYTALIELRKRLTEKSFNFTKLSKRFVTSAE